MDIKGTSFETLLVSLERNKSEVLSSSSELPSAEDYLEMPVDERMRIAYKTLRRALPLAVDERIEPSAVHSVDDIDEFKDTVILTSAKFVPGSSTNALNMTIVDRYDAITVTTWAYHKPSGIRSDSDVLGSVVFPAYENHLKQWVEDAPKITLGKSSKSKPYSLDDKDHAQNITEIVDCVDGEVIKELRKAQKQAASIGELAVRFLA